MRMLRGLVLSVCLLGVGAGPVWAEETQPGIEAAQAEQMEKMNRLGAPGEAHKALQPFVGRWTYTGSFWMAPDQPPMTMKGMADNTLIFGQRFLKQRVFGDPMEAGGRPFKGLGFIGYDNLRKEYQTIWFDNMMTGIMRGIGQFDASTQTLSDSGTFSCPMTGEADHWYRSAWTVVDFDHTRYESYSKTPEGKEFKAMEILYTRGG